MDHQQQDLTVILADDHNIVREGIASLCTANGWNVIGQCADGEAAVEMVNRLKPDIAIIDVRLPSMNGIEVIRTLRNSGCISKLMVLTVAREETTVRESLRVGADAYVLKDGPGRHLLDAIAFVRDGGVWISPVLRGVRAFTRGERTEGEDPWASFSRLEMEVFYYNFVNGLTTKEIADVLGISPKTVETYRTNLMRKLKVHHRLGLVRFAIERSRGEDGLVGVGSVPGPRFPHRPPRAAAADPPPDSHYKIE